jgi:hypothetical protein
MAVPFQRRYRAAPVWIGERCVNTPPVKKTPAACSSAILLGGSRGFRAYKTQLPDLILIGPGDFFPKRLIEIILNLAADIGIELVEEISQSRFALDR